MPGQALLKATLLKETYVPLVDLNGTEKNHGVVRVLRSRLSLMERRFLDQIAPKFFPAREQFNELRQAPRLQRGGFQVQDVIKVYERLIAASAAKSKGYTTLAPVDEDFELSPVKLQPLVPPPNQDACDIGFDRSAQPVFRSSPGSSPEVTLTSYRNAIFENVMFQLEEKWRKSNWDDTEHTTGFPIKENLTEREPGRTRLTGGGPDGGRSEEDLDVMSRSVSSEASERDWNPSPYFEDNDSVGSLEISFEIPVARGSPGEDNSAVMTTTSWGYYLGCTVARGSTAISTPSTPTTGSQAIGSINSKMVESVVASVIQPTVDNNGGENVTKQSGGSVDGESPDDYSDTFLSFGRPDESRNSLRKLLNGDSDARISSNGRLFPRDFVSKINNIIDQDDEVNGERSLMSTLRHSREVDHVVGHVKQSKGNFTDGRDQHLTDVEKSGSDRAGVEAGVEARQLSPNRLSGVSQNSSTKCNGDSHHASIERLSKTFGKSQSMKESTVLPDAKQDLSGRRAGLVESAENSSATHGDNQHRSIGRSSPTSLRSLSMKESVPAAKLDFSSRRAGVPTITQNSSAESDGNSQHRSPGRDSPTVLRSLSMNDSTVIAEAKQDFSSRKAGVPDKVPNSSDKSHGGSQHRSLERFSRFFGKSKSMKERTVSTAVKQDFSATASPAEIHGSLERLAKPSLARRTIEKIQGMPGRTTRLQPVVDSTASEKQISQESHVEKSTTLPHEEPLHNNNSNIALSLTQVVHGDDAGPTVKYPPERSRPKLGTLFEDARDTETEKLFVETCSGCTMFRSLKSILGYRKGIFRIKLLSSWLHGVGWMNNSSKVGASKRMDETPPKELPKGSLAGRGATIKRKWRRSPRSSPKRMMMSPKRKADRGRYNRKPIKILVGRKAKEVEQSRSPNRAVSNEGRSTEASTNKIHPVGCILDGRPSVDSSATAAALAVNVGVFTDINHSGGRDQTGDMNHSGGRNQTGKDQVHPIPGLRHLRSRSTSSRFLREYIARQEEMVQSQTVGAGG